MIDCTTPKQGDHSPEASRKTIIHAALASFVVSLVIIHSYW